MEIKIQNIERLPEAAAQFIEEMERNHGLAPQSSSPVIFAFYAPMGAGKTTFISEVCRQLGSEDEASSPTFSIVNEYDTNRWGKVYHLDCYRLDSNEEAFDIGVEDYFASGRPCFVEWPEQVADFLPEDAVTVAIRIDNDGQRTIEIP